MFSYHFNMRLFRAKTFLGRPSAKRTHSATGPLSKTKGFVFRLNPSAANVCFFSLGTMSFKLWEPAVPYHDSRLASKT